MLTQPFAFYSFGVSINAEQSKEIMDQSYPRSLEARILDLIEEKDVINGELTSIRKMIKTFKATEEQSNKKIF